jgi:hypothetical protein
VARFRAHLRAALLKRIVLTSLCSSNQGFPRAPARGSIEATVVIKIATADTVFPRAPARGSIEAFRSLVRVVLIIGKFPRAPARGSIEASFSED